MSEGTEDRSAVRIAMIHGIPIICTNNDTCLCLFVHNTLCSSHRGSVYTSQIPSQRCFAFAAYIFHTWNQIALSYPIQSVETRYLIFWRYFVDVFSVHSSKDSSQRAKKS